MTEEMRTCPKCQIEKPLTPEHFYRIGEGFEKVCKDCRNDRPNSYLPGSIRSVPKKVPKKATSRKKK